MRFSILVLTLSTLPALLVYTAANPAYAQSNPEYKSGLNYTTFGAPPSEPQEQEPAMNAAPAPTPRTILPMVRPLADQLNAQEPAAGTPTPAEPQEQEETRIWNKYKALATGGNTPKETNPEATKTLTPHQPLTLETTQKNHISTQPSGGMKTWSAPVQSTHQTQLGEPSPEPSQEATGLTALLKKWQASKAQQSELRTKHFPVPQGLGTVNDSQAQPKTPAPQPP